MTDLPKLPDTRHGIRLPVKFTTPDGNDSFYPVTFNISDEGKIFECFVSQDDSKVYKSGSQLLALLQDGCRLASRCLRHGDSIQELANYCGEDRGEGQTIGRPSSIIGAIARTGAEIEAMSSAAMEHPIW